MRVSCRLWCVVVAALVFAGCGRGGVKVVVPPLSAVTLNVVADTVQVNGSVQFAATALDLSSNPVAVPFAWTTSDPSVFTVSSTGLVTGRGEGSGQLFVEAGGLRDTADILVLPATGGWYAQTSNSSRQLNDLFFFANARHGCVVGNAGEVLTTNDAGDTWDHWASGTAFNLNAVWFATDSLGWAVGTNGTILRTKTGGRTWTLVPSGASENLTDVYFTDSRHGWVVGANGVVLRTTDGDSTWSKQYVTPNALNGVSFAGLLDGWAVGNGGVIFGTHDGGANWYRILPALTAQSIRAVVRLGEPAAFAVGAQGVAPRTVAGPDSTIWELQTAGGSNSLEGVRFVSTSQGWATGTNAVGIVLTTTDAGLTWNPQTVPSGSALHAIWFVDALRGWVVGDYGRILHTGSGGQ